MTPEALPTSYICPGEEHSISRPVHLSRLAAFYPKCRHCQYRNDTGQLPQQTLDRLQSTECRVERPSLFTREGIRGIYLNELTRHNAGQMAAGLASLLWEETPLRAKSDQQQPRSNHRPVIVVGYDERPSSPDIVTGVVTALRRMGCQVIDTNLTTSPGFAFAVEHLHAAAGIYVTGSGRDPSWSGLDVVGRRARPFSAGDGLERLEHRFRQGFSRPTRRAGPHRIFQATLPYEAGLWKHFHALRPLRVCCACGVRLIRQTLLQIFEKLPCELQMVDMPARSRNVNEAQDPDVERIGAAVRKQQAHLGILIDDDGCCCSFFDETGNLVSSATISVMLASQAATEREDSRVVLESHASAEIRTRIESLGIDVATCEPTKAAMYGSMFDERSVLGAGAAGRFWFPEAVPTCDAIVALGKILQGLSLSDAAFSKIVP